MSKTAMKKMLYSFLKLLAAHGIGRDRRER
jgi:hypothetical protein